MAVNISPAMVGLLNRVDDGYVPFAFMVPLRVVRVIASINFKTFRVEQFVRTNKDNFEPRGSWHTLSTHGSETPGAMLNTAMQAAAKAQADLRAKVERKYAKKKLITP
jgi:hypothetical protein